MTLAPPSAIIGFFDIVNCELFIIEVIFVFSANCPTPVGIETTISFTRPAVLTTVTVVGDQVPTKL